MSLVAVAAFLVHPLRARFEVVGVDAPRMLAKVVDFDLARKPIDWQAKDDLAHGPVRQQRGVLENIGMVAGMKGVSITEHAGMLTAVPVCLYNAGLRSAFVAPRRSVSNTFQWCPNGPCAE